MLSRLDNAFGVILKLFRQYVLADCQAYFQNNRESGGEMRELWLCDNSYYKCVLSLCVCLDLENINGHIIVQYFLSIL